MVTTTEIEMSSEPSQAHTNLLNLQFGFVNSMAIRCAIQLGIPDIIHSHEENYWLRAAQGEQCAHHQWVMGTSPLLVMIAPKGPTNRETCSSPIGDEHTVTMRGAQVITSHSHDPIPTSLADLAASISISAGKTSHLGRLVCLLVHLGIFTSTAGNGQPEYLLTATSRLLLASNCKSNSVAPYSRMVLDPYLVNPCFYFSDWLKMEGSMPFELCHGSSMWEVAAKSPEFNKGFNAAMASDSQFLMSTIVEQCPHIFQDLQSLIDVGGGIGGSATTIARAFPHLNVKVLDLPHVAAVMPKEAGVDVIGGDMFKHIPPTDAVFLKWILHDWNDEECVQILRKCKEAVPCKEGGGKVIIVEVVVNSKARDHKYTQAEYCADVMMMALTTGWERDKQEWSKIFKEAGFKEYKITPGFGVRSLIELYH